MNTSVALYRKYRGHTLSDIVGQDHITKPLGNAIAAGHISHAYLFTGPHGVGKTSIARILAHEINKLEYTDSSEHLDIIEIDAASNRRIDEIRDLREKVHIAPTSAKYKVYIIDEVHMLTREAFNALLKTLEEPPAHVVFILATTEAHKLPETIISRTQRHTFRPIMPDDAKKHLSVIAKQENVHIDDEALTLLAEHGRGSFRDSISLLDQIARSNTGKKITKKDVEHILGLAPKKMISTILESIEKGDTKLLLEQIDSAHENGINATTLAQQIIMYIRQTQRTSQNINTAEITFIDDLLSIPLSAKPDIKLEITLLKHSIKNVSTNHQEVNTSTKEKEHPKKVQATKASVPSVSEDVKTIDADIWKTTIDTIKSTKNNALCSMLRMCKPTFHEPNSVILYFRFPFHKKQAEQKKNIAVIQETLSQLLNKDIIVQCSVDEATKEQHDSQDSPKQSAQNILEAFGGGEVLG